VKQLHSLAANSLVVNGTDVTQFVLLCTEPDYVIDEDGEVQKFLPVTAIRIGIQLSEIPQLIDQLEGIYDAQSFEVARRKDVPREEDSEPAAAT